MGCKPFINQCVDCGKELKNKHSRRCTKHANLLYRIRVSYSTYLKKQGVKPERVMQLIGEIEGQGINGNAIRNKIGEKHNYK